MKQLKNKWIKLIMNHEITQIKKYTRICNMFCCYYQLLLQQMQKQQKDQGSGFLLTCDKNKQKQAVKDASNFLSEYIQDVYGDIQTLIIHKQLDKLGKQHNLQNEMQIRSSKKNKLKLLSSVETNVNCLIFMKLNENLDVKIDPYRVVDKIMRDVHNENRQLTRFCHKIIPVERSFKAEHFKMLDQIDEMFQKRDNSEKKSWALDFKCRNNSKFNYKQVLAKSEQVIKKYQHFVDIYYPQWTVAVHIVNHLMCLAILQNYKLYDEYRLHKKGAKVNNIQTNSYKDKKQIIEYKRRDKQENKNRDSRKQDNKDKQLQKHEQGILKEGQNQDQLNKQNKQDEKRHQHQKNVQQGYVDKQVPKQGQAINSNGNRSKKQKQVNKLLEQRIGVQEDQDVDFV